MHLLAVAALALIHIVNARDCDSTEVSRCHISCDGCLDCIEVNFQKLPCTIAPYGAFHSAYFPENNITSIPQDIFKVGTGYRELWKLLTLTHNHVTALYNNSFHGLSRLQQLYLDHNNITYIEAGAWHGLNSLRYLSLGVNSFTSIDSTTFYNLTTLQELHINGGNFSVSIDSGAFWNFAPNATVYLEGLPISYLSSSAFPPEMVTFQCGTTDVDDDTSTCSSTACQDACGVGSVCQVNGIITPTTEFTCIHAE